MYLKIKLTEIFGRSFKKVLAGKVQATIFALQLREMERWSRG
jgi:hypothetical protein